MERIPIDMNTEMLRLESQTPAHLDPQMVRGRSRCIAVASQSVRFLTNSASFSLLQQHQHSCGQQHNHPCRSFSRRTCTLSTTIRAGRVVCLFILYPMSEVGMKAEAEHYGKTSFSVKRQAFLVMLTSSEGVSAFP